MLGRLDPRDGSFKQSISARAPRRTASPIGPDGAPWITEGGQNAIARVDPGDHKVTLFRLPEKYAYANLNTGVFDKERHLLVHRPEPASTAGSIRDRATWTCSRRRGALAPMASR